MLGPPGLRAAHIGVGHTTILGAGEARGTVRRMASIDPRRLLLVHNPV